jgi:hypothetical protein
MPNSLPTSSHRPLSLHIRRVHPRGDHIVAAISPGVGKSPASPAPQRGSIAGLLRRAFPSLAEALPLPAQPLFSTLRFQANGSFPNSQFPMSQMSACHFVLLIQCRNLVGSPLAPCWAVSSPKLARGVRRHYHDVRTCTAFRFLKVFYHGIISVDVLFRRLRSLFPSPKLLTSACLVLFQGQTRSFRLEMSSESSSQLISTFVVSKILCIARHFLPERLPSPTPPQRSASNSSKLTD